MELWCSFVLEPLSLSLVCVCLFLNKKELKKNYEMLNNIYRNISKNNLIII